MEKKKSSGCLQQGCGTIVLVAAVVFFITQCGPALLSYLAEEPGNPPESQAPAVVSAGDRETQPAIPEQPPPAETEPEEDEPEETIVEAGALSEAIEKPEASDAILVRDYAWEYGDWEYTWRLNIPEAAYDYFKGLPRPWITRFTSLTRSTTRI